MFAECVAAPLSLDDKWKQMESAAQKVAENTIGYTRKQTKNEWFDEECARVNEKKNAAKARAFGVKSRNPKNAFKPVRGGKEL
jgi:hypothetical protein